MAKRKPAQFCGVPTVRLFPVKGGWAVQMRSTDTSNDWKQVGDQVFATQDEAADEAPYLCGF